MRDDLPSDPELPLPSGTDALDSQDRRLARPRRTFLLVALLLLAGVAAAAVMAFLPFTVPMPDYWTDAQQLLTTGRVLQHFTPSGYAAQLAVGMRLLPDRPTLGVELVQALLQLATVFAGWSVILELGGSSLLTFAGGLVLALHPELLLTVVKVWDVNLSTLLLLLLLAGLLWMLRRGQTPASSAVIGAVWAFGVFDRPNYLALLPAVLFALWRATPQPERAAHLVRSTALLLAVGAGTYASLSLAVYREMVFPGNGPYNLYAGQNEFTERTLLERLNAETAINRAIQAANLPPDTHPHDLALRPYFTHAALAYAAGHPADEVRLIGLKLFTLLRADTKLHPIGTPEGNIELALVLPVPIWIFLLARSRMRREVWTTPDTLVCLTSLLYTAPFLITNSDPRFRMPLDALAIAHSAALLSRGPAIASTTAPGSNTQARTRTGTVIL